MHTVQVNYRDIEALARALREGTLSASGPPAASALLHSLVPAILAAAGDGKQPVTVGVDVVRSVQDTVDAAFTPEPQPHTDAPGQHFKVHLKITR